jgi:hypothetical protein
VNRERERERERRGKSRESGYKIEKKRDVSKERRASILFFFIRSKRPSALFLLSDETIEKRRRRYGKEGKERERERDKRSYAVYFATFFL